MTRPALILALFWSAAASADCLELSDGSTLSGTAQRTDAGWDLALADGTRLPLPSDAVRGPCTEPTAPADPPGWDDHHGGDPNASSYFLTPSAYSLGRGRVAVSQQQLLFTSVSVGLTDHWDVQLGTAVPLLLHDRARIGTIGTRVGVPIGPRTRIGAGAQVLSTPAAGTLGTAFAALTVGDANRHVTVAAGPAIDLTSAEPRSFMVSAAALVRVAPRLALVTDNWLVSATKLEDSWAMPSGGVRLYGERVAVDLGGALYIHDSAAVPMPWLDFTWNFGG